MVLKFEINYISLVSIIKESGFGSFQSKSKILQGKLNIKLC